MPTARRFHSAAAYDNKVCKPPPDTPSDRRLWGLEFPFFFEFGFGKGRPSHALEERMGMRDSPQKEDDKRADTQHCCTVQSPWSFAGIGPAIIIKKSHLAPRE